MKRIVSKILLFIISLVLIFFLTYKKTYAKDLDVIENYDVTVDPDFSNGSLDIKIDLRWHVLDSSSEGPLSWIKVGIPNYYADKIKGLSSNIKKIEYYSDDGAFIRVDLDKDYYAGDILDISFSFNQSHMYHISGEEIVYDYSPGYFEDIAVNNATLRWNAKNVKKINNPEFKLVDGYYVYSHKLWHGETIGINLVYDNSSFNSIDPKGTYTDDYDKYFWVKFWIWFGVIIGIIVISLIIGRLKKDPYKAGRGFYVPNNWDYFYHFPFYRNRYSNGGVSKEGKRINPPSSVGGGRSGGGGCACACACAGGGRAGCSMKDYYHTNLKSNEVLKILSKKDK